MKTHAMGDLLMVTPALRRAKQGYPNHRLVVVTTARCAPLLQHNPAVDRVCTLRSLSVPSVAACMLRLRPLAADLALVFHAAAPLVAAARLTGARVVSLRDLGQEWPPPFHVYTPSVYLRLLDGLVEGEEADPMPRLHLTEAEHRQVHDLVGTRPYAVVAPGGGVNPRQEVRAKRWPATGFAQVCRFLAGMGLLPVVVGCREEAPVGAVVAQGGALNLVGKTSVRVLAALVAKASVVVTNDSLPLHLAVALDRPLVGLFGPTSPSNFVPPGRPHQRAVSSPLTCSPCYGNGIFRGCKWGRPVCMESIPYVQVEEAVRAVMP